MMSPAPHATSRVCVGARESVVGADYSFTMKFDFDRVAAGWDRWHAVREGAARALTERLISAARVGLGATVLDIGTGPGEPAFTVARAVGEHGRVIGLDIAPAMVELARRRSVREAVSNVEFHISDGLANAPEGRYDAVLSRWGLMFFADVDAVLHDVFARLRPGGSFAMATWGKPHEVPFISLPIALGAGAGGASPNLDGGPFALHDADDLIRRLSAAGFAEVVSEPIEVVYELESSGDYFEHVSEMVPPVAAFARELDGAGLAAFRSAVEWRAAQRFGNPDGSLRIPNRALITSGTRPT